MDASHAAAMAAGLSVAGPPEARPWGVRDFRLTDPDGNQLNISTRLPAARTGVEAMPTVEPPRRLAARLSRRGQ
ncbi:MAG TPA: hypothetical protein PKD53_29560 [Chloroflexaceae bacterium]|nr:hypothetical protein [Chloroflexaceae bacterium]